MIRVSLTTLVALAMAGTAATSIPTLAGAQTTAPQILCMSGETVDAERKSFTFYVPSSQASVLTERGFRVASCQSAIETLEEFRSRVCALNRAAPQSIKISFAERHEITLGELCELAGGDQ